MRVDVTYDEDSSAGASSSVTRRSTLQARVLLITLQAASKGGHEKVVQMLLDRGTDVNAQGGFGNALQAASGKVTRRWCIRYSRKAAEINAQGEIMALDLDHNAFVDERK